MISSVLAASFLVTAVVAQGSATTSSITPLASQHFTWGQLPEQVQPNDSDRGPQYGYNICNSTTQGQSSLCQTSIINAIDDFCLWAPPIPNSLVADWEGEMVAWCTKPGYGTRVIPPGALTAVQFMKTPDYIQVTGLMNGTMLDLADDGGEMDPHGADGLGNPMGGLVFTKNFTGSFEQVIEWHNFMGGGQFCFKACDPAGANAANFCQHIYDRIGCNYNAPAAYQPNVFESCDGDDQDFPGVYTGADGQVSTYSQPPESLGPIESLPYTARIPASSNCVTYTSSLIYNAATATTSSGSSMATATKATNTNASAKATGTAKSTSSGTASSAASGAKQFSLDGTWMSLGAVIIGAFVGAMGVL